MIYRVKCLGIVTLKVLPTICFCYNWEKESTKFQIPRIKLNKGKCLENLEKGQVLKNLSRIAYVRFNISKNVIALCFGDGHKWRVDCFPLSQIKKYEKKFTLISHILFMFVILQTSLAIKKSLKFNLFVISKFRFGRLRGKMLKKLYKIIRSLNLTSHRIFHYLWPVDLSKSYSQLIVSIFKLIVSIFIFSQDFFQ